MAVDLFLAGDIRLVLPSATFMVHTVSSDIGGKNYETKIQVQENERLFKKTANLFEARADNKAVGYLKAKQWLKKIEAKDYFFDAEESIRLGFSHRILESGDLP